MAPGNPALHLQSTRNFQQRLTDNSVFKFSRKANWLISNNECLTTHCIQAASAICAALPQRALQAAQHGRTAGTTRLVAGAPRRAAAPLQPGAALWRGLHCRHSGVGKGFWTCVPELLSP